MEPNAGYIQHMACDSFRYYPIVKIEGEYHRHLFETCFQTLFIWVDSLNIVQKVQWECSQNAIAIEVDSSGLMCFSVSDSHWKAMGNPGDVLYGTALKMERELPVLNEKSFSQEGPYASFLKDVLDLLTTGRWKQIQFF